MQASKDPWNTSMFSYQIAMKKHTFTGDNSKTISALNILIPPQYLKWYLEKKYLTRFYDESHVSISLRSNQIEQLFKSYWFPQFSKVKNSTTHLNYYLQLLILSY